MATLKVTAIPAFADNYFWLIHAPQATRQVLVVDPGEAAPVQRALQDGQLSLQGILTTHRHADHVGGVAELLMDTAVPVFGPAHEAIPGSPQRLSEGQQVSFGSLGLQFTVVDLPGHTAGHIGYYGHGVLFCGDTLFSAGCGRLFDGTAAQMTASLQKLAALPEVTEVYCAHEYTLANLRFALAVEPDNAATQRHWQRCSALRREGHMTLPSTIALELSINPFLRLNVQSVRQAAEQHVQRRLDSATEIFTVLREWKNHFQG